MVNAQAPRRFISVVQSVALVLGLSVACTDNDLTVFCLEPACFGVDAGRGGSTGAASPDSGADAGPERCEVTFVSPTLSSDGSLQLDASDDADGEACGVSFSANVTLASSGSRINLFVNDNPLGALPVDRGRVTFVAELGNRGDTSNTLRAEATMADGRLCSAVLGPRLLVGCPGPSCSIDNPRANPSGFLNQADDGEPGAAGLQTSIEVTTEAENTGKNASLSIDGQSEGLPPSLIRLATGVGRATFGDVTLEAGQHTIRAECEDSDGLRAFSPLIHWDVDLTGCSLEIEGVGSSNGAPVTSADDIDANPANGIDVRVRGTVHGDDCASIQVGACDVEVPRTSLSGRLSEDGSFSLPLKLPARTEIVELCARVIDDAGNVSTPDQRLDVEVLTDASNSSGLVIESPAAGTHYNRRGTAGAVADLAPASQVTCELDVVVACRDPGAPVELLADDTLVSSAACVAQGGLGDPASGRATFAGVSLASRDDGETTALRARQRRSGLPVSMSSAVLVQLDCSAPSCSFESPDPSVPFLNDASDNPSVAGFQTDFVVATDAQNVGRNVRLTLDHSPQRNLTSPVLSGPGGAVAMFEGVTLSESSHDVQATCSDPAGNEQTTGLVSWTVDITSCSASLSVAAGHDPIVPNDDLEPGQPNLQVPVAGVATGSGCNGARVGLCGSMSGPFGDLEEDGSFLLTADIPSAPATALGVCAEVRDTAGNVTSTAASVNVRVAAPSVVFDAPSNGATFNQLSTCDTEVVVSCSENGAPVELFADGDSQGSTSCASNVASFELSLATHNDGQPSVLSAVQTAQGVPSVPASIEVYADCEEPELSIDAPACNSQLALSGDDVNPGLTGLQVDVTVQNDGTPDVTLTVTAAGSTVLDETGDETSTEFAGVSLGGAGSVTLDACATDAAGNTGCASCALTVIAEPTLTIARPRPPAVLSVDDDCDGALGGLQVRVRGTSNATDGSDVVIALGEAAPTTTPLASGIYSACVEATDGDDQLLSVTVTDDTTGLSRTSSVLVSINTSPPAAIGAPTVEITGRREGTLTLTWNSVLDSGGDPLADYQLRCALQDILTEQAWNAATPLPVTLTPASSAGQPQEQDVDNFRTGMVRHCMVRGEDAYGQLSPLGPTTSVNNPFLSLEYTGVTTNTGTRMSVSALGDINGDDEDDFAYGTSNAGVNVYFGGPDLDASPDIVITGPAVPPNHELGANVVGLGDINGDGRPDFAVTARALSHPGVSVGGSVFVFFGRASSEDWAALTPIVVAANPGCGADICFHSSEATATLGSSVTSTNFDGTGFADIVIGAQSRTQGSTGIVGRAYVVLGGAQLNVPSNTIIELPAGNPNGFVIDPSLATRNFGINVAAVGTGADARGDLVISSIGRPGDNIRGEAFSVQGVAFSGSGLVALSLDSAFASGAANTFGSPMRAVGDVNQDGFGDVWISANFDPNGISPVYLGRSAGYSGVALFSFTNDGVDNEWGSYVATGFSTELGPLGDLDDNGYDDLMIGSIFANGARGTANLFYSDATTGNRARSGADATFTSSANGQMTPSFVGDISGDGFRDIAILDSGSLQQQPTTRLTLLY
jgi:hypothetical protein